MIDKEIALIRERQQKGLFRPLGSRNAHARIRPPALRGLGESYGDVILRLASEAM